MLIGGSAWMVPMELDEATFIKLLERERFECRAFSPGCKHVPVGDSKKLYRSGDSLLSLEAGLLALLATTAVVALPSTLAELIKLLTRMTSTKDDPPWYQDLGLIAVPQEVDAVNEIKRLSSEATERLSKHGISLVSVKARVVAEPEFNAQVQTLGSKGLLLSRATFGLISELLSVAPDLPAEIFCDRQGGRTNYLPLLMDWQPEMWFMESERTKLRCSYRSAGDCNYTIHFTIGGDNFAPTALASMAAKYLRERFMEAFNAYWVKQVPGLRPTAGYPVDAARFRREIEPVAQSLGLALDEWWRCR